MVDKCICRIVEKDKQEYICHGNWNSLAIRRDRLGLYSIVALGDGEAEMHIKYCPICGRDLDEGR